MRLCDARHAGRRIPARSRARPPPDSGLRSAAAALGTLGALEDVPGAAATIGLTVLGQQLASLPVDRYGLLCLPRRPLPRARKAGVAALLAGVAAIQLL